MDGLLDRTRAVPDIGDDDEDLVDLGDDTEAPARAAVVEPLEAEVLEDADADTDDDIADPDIDDDAEDPLAAELDLDDDEVDEIEEEEDELGGVSLEAVAEEELPDDGMSSSESAGGLTMGASNQAPLDAACRFGRWRASAIRRASS